MVEKRAEVTISGHVQGVYFRANTRDRAKRFGLKGWVKNLANGNVKAVLEGDENDIESLINWFHKGPPMARVDDVKVDWKDPSREFERFKIRH